MEIHPSAVSVSPLAGCPDLGALTVVEQVPAPEGTVFLKAIHPTDRGIYWIAMQRTEPTEADTPPLMGDSCQTVQNLAERMMTALQEKARAEERLRQQERFYKGLLENAFDCVMVKNADGKVVYISPGIRSFGLQPEQLLGQNGFELFHPDDLVPMQETFRAIPCGPGQSHRSKHRIRFPDGQVRTLEVVGRNMLHDEAIRGFVINFRDISEQTRIEEELAQKERYFRALFDNSFDVTFTRDAAGRITYISPSVQRVLGYTPDELTGKVAIDVIVHPDDAQATRDGAASLAGDPNYLVNNRTKMVRKDGKVIVAESVVKNLLDDEAVRGYLVTFRDVTEQFETEARLARRERYFRSLVEDATDVVAIADKNVNFFYTSPPVQRLLGYTPEEYIRLNGVDLVHPDYLARVEETFNQVLQEPGKLAKAEFLFRHKEGHYVFLEVIFKNMLHDEAVRGVVMNSRDVTERKEAERILKEYNENLEKEVARQTRSLTRKNRELEKTLANLQNAQLQLVEAEKMASLGQLTAGIAHEINNPINFVSANVGPLKTDFAELRDLLDRYRALHASASLEKDLSEVRRYGEELDVAYLQGEVEALLNGIEEGASRTKEIVIGLRNFSRLDELDLKTASVHEGIDSTLMLLRSKLRSRIRVVKEYGTLPDIECYPGKLNQVFMNILGNAIAATPGEGTITIRTWQDGPCVNISIRDTGTGMSEKVKRHIFEPFYTTKEVGEGTGLGLSISYGIIQKHKGKIEVNSEPGQGSEFVITLPVRANG